MSGFGTNPVTTTQPVLPTNQFPLSSVAVPGAASGNLTALEGGPASTDSNGNSTAPASMYVKDGSDLTQGTTTDAAVTTDVAATISAKLRGLVKISGDIWDSTNHRIRVDGSGVTQPVSAASLPLPSGASTSAKQPALGVAGTASSDVITVQGIASMTALKTDGSGVTQPVSGSVSVSNFPGTQPISGTVTANAGTGTFNNQQSNTQIDYDSGAGTQNITVFGVALPASGGAVAGGTSSNPLRIDPTGATTQPVSGTVSAAQSGTWNITNVSGTVSLPTGAATSAKQPALGTAGTASSDVLTVQGIASMTALKVDGSGVTQPISGTVTANQGGTWTVQPGNTANTTAWKVDGSAVTQPVSGTITANIGTTNGLALDASVSGVLVSQGSTTSGQKGPLVQGAVTTAAPSYTTAQTSPISLTTAGAVRVDGSGVTQPVSAASLPLPTGASTSAKQPALGTAGTASSDVLTVQGIASMTALKVDGSAVTQPVSGTFWQATQPVSGTVTANIGTTNGLALDSSVNGVLVSQGSTTSGEKGPLIQGAVTTNAPSYTTAQTSPISLDTSGLLRASLKDTPSNTNNLNVNLAASAATVTVSATNLQTNINQVAGSAVSTAATGIMKVGVADGSGNAITSTASALDINIKSGGAGFSVADEAAWTAGTSTFVPAGGVFNDSAAALTSGQEGTARLTNNRAIHVNLRDASANQLLGSKTSANSIPVVIASDQGAVPASQSGTWTVQPGNTANTTAWKVDGSAVTQPISAASLPLPSGAATSAKQPALGTAGSASSDVLTVQGIASMTALKVDGSAVTQPVSGTVSITANSAVNLAQVAGGNTSNAGQTGAMQVGGAVVTNTVVSSATNPLLIAGSDYGGTPKVQSLKVDSSGNAQVAVTNTPTVTANAGTNLNTSALALDTSVNGVLLSQGSTTSGQKGPLVQGAVTTSAPLYTTAQTSPISLTTAGAVRVDGSATTQPVSGTFWQTTQPISASSLPLPTGAATSAKQPALGTAGSASSDVLTVQGIASMTALKVDGSGVTQPVSGTITANAGTNLNTSALALETGGNLATLAGTVSSAKVQTNTAQINGVAPTMGNGVSGTGVQRVTIASDSTGQVALAAGGSTIGAVTQASGPWTSNVTQFGGSNVATGTGAGGSGVPRVTVSNDSEIQLWDGTNGPVAVKAAATSPAIADKAIVAVISPNSTGLPVNLPVTVQSTNNKSSGSVASLAKAFVSNNTAGNSIIVVCGVGNGTAPTITDSNSNVYTQATPLTANGTALNVAVFYSVGPASGGGIAAGANTVTVNNGGTTASIAMEIYEVSGLITQVQAQPDQTATNTGSSGTASTVAISASSPNELAFAGIGVGTAAQTITAGSGWTNDSGQQNPTTPAGLFSFVSMSQFLGSLKSVTPQATFTSEPWGIAVATFRPVVLGVEGTVNLNASASGGSTPNHTISAASTNATSLKAAAGQVYGFCISNSNASARFFKLYNKASSPTVGTDTPVMTVQVPGGSTVARAFPVGLMFSTGIAWAITTGIANNDTGAVGTDISIDIDYE